MIPILYPHRPDPRKGIWETVRVVLAALDEISASLAERVRLLVPEWMDSNVAGDSGHVYQGIYGDVIRFAADAGWPDLVRVHRWLPPQRMAEYYSLGAATMCIGSFIEAFGNVSVESQLCGTPAIVSRVAAQRSVLPEDLVSKVDFGDEKEACIALVGALSGNLSVAQPEFADFIAANYSLSQMVERYGSAICGTGRTEPLPALNLTGPPEVVELPAWCALLKSGLYNDYAYGYASDQRLGEVAGRAHDGPVKKADLADLCDDADLGRWIAEGYLVPVRWSR